MPLTLRDLVSVPELNLALLTAGPGIDLPVTWVHVSELRDPTPFLSGGELLLTTGLAFDRGTPTVDVAEYVRRLSEASVVGLGFGTGLSHSRVPDDLLTAAREVDLPIVEVPRQTPFIAISRSVSKAVAADEYAAVTRTFTAQQALTKAALSPAGPQRLVRLLAQQLAAWVLLLDPAGAVIAASPDAGTSDQLGSGFGTSIAGSSVAASAGAASDSRFVALVREVTSLAAHRGTVSSAFPLGPDAVSVQSVGTGPRGRAFLAVGRPGTLTAADRHLVNAAVMLLTIRLEQSSTADTGIGRLRSALLRMVLAGETELARPIAEGSAISLPTEPVSVVVATGDVAGMLEMTDEAGAQIPSEVLVAELDEELVAVVGGPAEVAQTWAARVGRTDPAAAGQAAAGGSAAGGSADRVLTSRAGSDGDTVIGISAPASYSEIAVAFRQAKQANAFAQQSNRPVTSFAEIAMAGITGIVVPGAARAFADAQLQPLVEHDLTGRGDLVNSLRVWLAHHGQWDPSATALGVHRHTLRHRMRTVEELLGRSLDAPGTRSELWFALELRDEH